MVWKHQCWAAVRTSLDTCLWPLVVMGVCHNFTCPLHAASVKAAKEHMSVPAGMLHRWPIQLIKISMCLTRLALKGPQFVFVQLDSQGLSPVLCNFLVKLCVVIGSTFLTCWAGSFQTCYVTITPQWPLQPPVNLINTTPTSSSCVDKSFQQIMVTAGRISHSQYVLYSKWVSREPVMAEIHIFIFRIISLTLLIFWGPGYL